MKVPLNWLREYCDPDLDTAQIEERLTMTGTKVETVLRHGAPEIENFVVGRVLSVQAHPNADRLRVCSVDVGAGEPAGIVCGAPNVAAGQTVAVALPGAVMPGGAKIKAAKLRGVASSGMILSAQELQIDTDHSGIMVLEQAILDAGQSDFPPGAPNVVSIADRLSAGTGLSPGTALADVLSVGTDVLELEITPNRPDCLGVYGVARELHAATGAPLADPPWQDDPAASPGGGGSGDDGSGDGGSGDGGPSRGSTIAGEHGSLAEVVVQCPDLCPRFTARAFAEVKVGPSPLWLKARLSAAGQRPINNVVDITNYAMLLTGQPLHAFDLDRVAGGTLTVRRARDGEQVTTLDGQVRTLDSEMVVIDDADGPTSIAGIMGGERSEVHAGTTRVLMEVANWSGPNIHRTSWALGLRSEASSRFEKGLAPEQCLHAQAVATKLMVELCGAKLLAGTIDVCEPLPVAERIELREARLQAILGMAVPCERQAEILRALDFGVSELSGGQAVGSDAATGTGPQVSGVPESGDGRLVVTVPPVRRQDVSREADLIEEVARIAGLESLPATLPARRGAYGRLSERQRLQRRAVDALVGRGLYEAVGWTFTAPGLHDRLRLDADDPRRHAPTLENPLSEDQTQLRTTLLGSLLDVAAHNVARGMADLRLFELGTVFALAAGSPNEEAGANRAEGALEGNHGSTAARDDERGGAGGRDTGVREHKTLAVLLAGRLAPPTWAVPEPPVADYFAAKGVLEALGHALRIELECVVTTQPFLHPGRAASVRCGGREVGWVGELHPLVAKAWDLDGAAVFELDLDRVLDVAARQHGYVDLISYPSLRQDLAVVLPVEVPAARAIELVRAAGGELLHGVEVFDVYEGPALPPPSSGQSGGRRRSLALALSFRASDRTLSDADVVPLRERIVVALEELGGELRA